MNIRVDLNLISLNKQVNVIWLSKVIPDLVLLEHQSGISQAYISYILTNEEEILNRWLNTSSCSKYVEKYKTKEKTYEFDAINRILFEWAKRKWQNVDRILHSYEIELHAEVIKQQLGVPEYSMGMDFWNKDYNYKLSSNEGIDQFHSLDTVDILNGICNEIHPPTYKKFKNLLGKLDRIKPIEARMFGLNDELEQVSSNVKDIEAIEYDDISQEEEKTSGIELRNETVAVNAGQAEENEEEMADLLCEESTYVIPKTGESEKYMEESFHTRSKSKDVMNLKENAVYKHSFIKYESNTTEESAEDEYIRQEVIDILAELQQEIEAEDMSDESRCSPQPEDCSVDSITALSSASTSLDADYDNFQEGPPHSIQNVNTMILQTTDTIEELVLKYEVYKSQQQNLHTSKIRLGNQDILHNPYIEIDEMRKEMQKQKEAKYTSDDKLAKQVLNRDYNGIMNKTDFLPSPDNIENPRNYFTEVANNEELTEYKAKDSIIFKDIENSQRLISKFENTRSTHRVNKFDDFNTKLEQKIMENDTLLECVMSEDKPNSGLNEEESNIFANNSEFKFEESHDVLMTENEREATVYYFENDQKKERFEILLETIPVKEIDTKNVEEQNNIEIAMMLENSNDFEDTNIQVIETTSDEEDVQKTVHSNSYFSCNKIKSDTTQARTVTKDLSHCNIEKVCKSKTNSHKACRHRRRKSIEANAPKTNTEYVKAVPHKRRKLATEDNSQKRICGKIDPKNRGTFPKTVLKQSESDSRSHSNNMTLCQENDNIIHSLNDESDLENVDCNFDDNEDFEFVTLLEIVSDEDDEILLMPPRLNTCVNVIGLESTIKELVAMGSPPHSVNDRFHINSQDDFSAASGKDNDVHVLPTVTDRNCIDLAVGAIKPSEEPCNSNLYQFSITEVPAEEGTQEPINKYKSKPELLKTDTDAFSYLYKLRDFCIRQQDYEAFRLAVNLQMEFLPPNPV